MASSCPSRRRCLPCSRAAPLRAAPSRSSCFVRNVRRPIFPDMGFFDKIKASLTRTKEQFVERFDEIVGRADEPAQRSRPVDLETLDALEEALISADVGVAASDRIVSSVRQKRARGESLRALVKAEILEILRAADAPPVQGNPQVTLIVGVNGTGKTTTVGKLARLIKDSGRTPLICAADTFRAAAVEQLQVW